jgi:4-carboxymuconolactone decarboxylase
VTSSPARPTDCPSSARRASIGLAIAPVLPPAAAFPQTSMNSPTMTAPSPPVLDERQLAIGPIAAATAVGDMARLSAALASGLDAGLAIGEAKEVLVQLYAYAGFPRSLNALGELMRLVDDRSHRGIEDAAGREPAAVPVGEALLELGTANQTRLSGAPVRGPLFDFAPAIDRFLKAHLFGDIFARDNLDWQSRELATVAALSALTGVESQLAAHLRISLNVGLTLEQLRQFAGRLADKGEREPARRLTIGLDKLAEARK